MTKARYKAPVKRIELVTIVKRSELEWEAGASRASRGVANGDNAAGHAWGDVDAEGKCAGDREVVRELNGELRLRLALEEAASGRVADADDATRNTRRNAETEWERAGDGEVVRQLNFELGVALEAEWECTVTPASRRVTDSHDAARRTGSDVETEGKWASDWEVVRELYAELRFTLESVVYLGQLKQ